MPTSRGPDPARGVFETLLVIAGWPVELEAHLARLRASLKALFAAELPAPAAGLIERRGAGIDLGRLRLTVAPTESGLAFEAVASEIAPSIFFADWAAGAVLWGQSLPDGLGAHKWADRSLLQGAEIGAVPLLLDRREEVLEAAWANVFAASDGALLTPQADGRILPGIARSGAIEVAQAAGIEVRERFLGREELLSAEEVFLTSSVRGVTPARSLDGEPLPGPGELSRLVGDALRRRWTSQSAAPAPGRAIAPPPGRLAR